MEWQDKGNMIQLGNAAHNSDGDKKAYHDFVLSVIDDFDAQAIDMFITNTSIIPNEIIEDKEFYQIVSDKIKNKLDEDDYVENISLRVDLRLAYLETILEENNK
ncbi:MAG: hypothetical protein PF487_04475 [Bacteroidales bacterium]|jgi:serine/threonine protein phosphatase PrpC|nr:hypothetical protein [Bacteroidales bacterium]